MKLSFLFLLGVVMEDIVKSEISKEHFMQRWVR